MAKKVSTSVYLEPAQLAALQAASARLFVPMATLVRQGVDRVLADTANTISPFAYLTPEIISQFTPAEKIALAMRMGFEPKVVRP